MRGAVSRIKCRSWEGSNSHCEEWEAGGLTTRPRGLDQKFIKNHSFSPRHSEEPFGTAVLPHLGKSEFACADIRSHSTLFGSSS